MVLPHLSISDKPESIRGVVRTVCKRVGHAGRNALIEYVRKSKIPAQSDFVAIIEEVFGPVISTKKGRGRGLSKGGAAKH